MKTREQKEKDQKVKKLQEKVASNDRIILELTKQRKDHYDSLKDFKLSDNKTKVVIQKMTEINSSIKANKNRNKKLNDEIERMLNV